MGGRQAGNGSASHFHWKEKHNSASQIMRSDYDFLVPTDLVDHSSSSKTSAELYGLYPSSFSGANSTLPSCLPYTAQLAFSFLMLAECHFIPFCSLSLWLNSAPLCTNTHSVYVNSMMCLLKITDIDRALHSLQTTFPSIISNESPTILWGLTRGAVRVPYFIDKKTETWGDLDTCPTSPSQ